jgi:hypothetical protein
MNRKPFVIVAGIAALIVVPFSGTLKQPESHVEIQYVEVPREVVVEKLVEKVTEIPILKVERLVEYVNVEPNVRIHAEWELELSTPLANIDPPTRLDIIMWPDHMEIYNEFAEVRCEKMGGAFVKSNGQDICQGVDY